MRAGLADLAHECFDHHEPKLRQAVRAFHFIAFPLAFRYIQQPVAGRAVDLGFDVVRHGADYITAGGWVAPLL